MQPLPEPYRVIGVESSPYAVKVRAVLRYLRLPYIWVARMPQYFAETLSVRPLIMPVVQFPDGEYRTDSTPIIEALEQAHPSDRSIIPPDPAGAFVSALIEDLADEWLTKSLFNYRFSSPADQLSGARWVMDDAFPGLDAAALAARVADFIERQVARMPLVGCTPANTPVLEDSYRAFLAASESFVATDQFLFGTRPALADFGLYGQFSTLAGDPRAGAIMRDTAPRTLNWMRRLGDASGVNGSWYADMSEWPDAVRALLAIAGRYYLPFLAANRQALDDGLTAVEVELDGQPFRQPPYRYQGKCFDYLRRRYAGLPTAVRAILKPALEETGCLAFLAPELER